ncbi:hypothetical protein BDZ90DRAFT_258780 [Jaminaea rosea]|uniref:Uncharacterized protein n=1 Tax=Jaminaea rosea TaxID=1569628 RepID=A0A316UX62_9BASI|nr:hypothetical protein BDZ90DRAFT_258780 [Jaminaea rosea]PWN29879.1 hypothetical protein BDZ90DRAFT_258780 [Jaminaea rosea]
MAIAAGRLDLNPFACDQAGTYGIGLKWRDESDVVRWEVYPGLATDQPISARAAQDKEHFDALMQAEARGDRKAINREQDKGHTYLYRLGIIEWFMWVQTTLAPHPGSLLTDLSEEQYLDFVVYNVTGHQLTLLGSRGFQLQHKKRLLNAGAEHIDMAMFNARHGNYKRIELYRNARFSHSTASQINGPYPALHFEDAPVWATKKVLRKKERGADNVRLADAPGPASVVASSPGRLHRDTRNAVIAASALAMPGAQPDERDDDVDDEYEWIDERYEVEGLFEVVDVFEPTSEANIEIEFDYYRFMVERDSIEEAPLLDKIDDGTGNRSVYALRVNSHAANAGEARTCLVRSQLTFDERKEHKAKLTSSTGWAFEIKQGKIVVSGNGASYCQSLAAGPEASWLLANYQVWSETRANDGIAGLWDHFLSLLTEILTVNKTGEAARIVRQSWQPDDFEGGLFSGLATRARLDGIRIPFEYDPAKRHPTITIPGSSAAHQQFACLSAPPNPVADVANLRPEVGYDMLLSVYPAPSQAGWKGVRYCLLQHNDGSKSTFGRWKNARDILPCWVVAFIVNLVRTQARCTEADLIKPHEVQAHDSAALFVSHITLWMPCRCDYGAILQRLKAGLPHWCAGLLFELYYCHPAATSEDLVDVLPLLPSLSSTYTTLRRSKLEDLCYHNTFLWTAFCVRVPLSYHDLSFAGSILPLTVHRAASGRPVVCGDDLGLSSSLPEGTPLEGGRQEPFVIMNDELQERQAGGIAQGAQGGQEAPSAPSAPGAPGLTSQSSAPRPAIPSVQAQPAAPRTSPSSNAGSSARSSRQPGVQASPATQRSVPTRAPHPGASRWTSTQPAASSLSSSSSSAADRASATALANALRGGNGPPPTLSANQVVATRIPSPPRATVFRSPAARASTPVAQPNGVAQQGQAGAAAQHGQQQGTMPSARPPTAGAASSSTLRQSGSNSSCTLTAGAAASASSSSSTHRQPGSNPSGPATASAAASSSSSCQPGATPSRLQAADPSRPQAVTPSAPVLAGLAALPCHDPSRSSLQRIASSSSSSSGILRSPNVPAIGAVDSNGRPLRKRKRPVDRPGQAPKTIAQRERTVEKEKEKDKREKDPAAPPSLADDTDEEADEKAAADDAAAHASLHDDQGAHDEHDDADLFDVGDQASPPEFADDQAPLGTPTLLASAAPLAATNPPGDTIAHRLDNDPLINQLDPGHKGALNPLDIAGPPLPSLAQIRRAVVRGQIAAVNTLFKYYWSAAQQGIVAQEMHDTLTPELIREARRDRGLLVRDTVPAYLQELRTRMEQPWAQMVLKQLEGHVILVKHLLGDQLQRDGKSAASLKRYFRSVLAYALAKLHFVRVRCLGTYFAVKM